MIVLLAARGEVAFGDLPLSALGVLGALVWLASCSCFLLESKEAREGPLWLMDRVDGYSYVRPLQRPDFVRAWSRSLAGEHRGRTE